jgi:DNA-directed RNA polymerase subunit H (RpoH/RPB5)
MEKKQNSSSLISSIYKSRKNLIDLMKKQNYNVNEYANFSINEVNSMYQNKQLDISLEKNTDSVEKTKVYIHYILEKPTLRSAELQEIIDDLFNLEETLTKNDTLIIIIKEDMNETLTNEVKHIWERDNIFVTIINIKRLQFNILEHQLVPPHRVLPLNELLVIQKKYNITKLTDLPEISRFDPVAQVIGIRPGQVCEIIRPSKTAIKSYYYRVCV